MNGLSTLLREELDTIFSSTISSSEQDVLHSSLLEPMSHAFDKSTIMDSADQMHQVSCSAIPLILKFCKQNPDVSDTLSLSVLSALQPHSPQKTLSFPHSL